MKESLADLHNFGQRVTLETGPDGHLLYKKPRPIYWEWLFFGLDSPLVPFLQEDHHRDFGSVANSVFGLQVKYNSSDRGIGHSREVPTLTDLPESNAKDFGQFGMLLGYCYVLGIQDLHYQNVVRTRDRTQVIDAEVVLSNLILPSETLLLPLLDRPWSNAGIRYHQPDKNKFSINQIKSLIEGFSYSLQAVARKSLPLTESIERELSKHDPFPIRVILRDTIKYLNGTADIEGKPLFSEEIEQINRGDVPYFFKFLNSDEVYFYTSREGQYAKVAVPDYFKDIVKRVAIAPKYLLDQKRIETKLLPSGILHLCRTIIPSEWMGAFEISGIKIQVNPDEIFVSVSENTFAAKRHRAAASK
jgi:hypothetical protein